MGVACIDQYYLGVKRAQYVRRSNLYLMVISHHSCFKKLDAEILENSEVFQNSFSCDFLSKKKLPSRDFE